MKKTMAFILSGLMMILSSQISTAYATDNPNAYAPTTSEIISELKKYETPYYGDNFDFNNDGKIDVFDMVVLKKKLIAGEPGITIATAVRLKTWLLGKQDSLVITKNTSTWFDPSAYRNNYIKHLMSNNFKFVRVDEGSIHHSNGDVSPAVDLYFLCADEYTLESIFVYNFCNSIDEFDEFVAEGTGYSIGIKNGIYTLALSTSISKETENPVPLEISTEDVTEVAIPEQKLDSTFIQYDLTKPNLSNVEVRQTVDELSNYLNITPYSFTITKESYDKIQLSCKTELAEINILVYEMEPVKETPILKTDTFYLFYDNTKGFGLFEK